MERNLVIEASPTGGTSQEPRDADGISPPPPDALTRWPGFLLAWVDDLAARIYMQALAPLGIKPQHLGILTLLEQEGPMVQARLSDRLPIVKPQMVGLVNELAARGYVERRPHPTDRRAVEVHLLAPGEQCIRDAEVISVETTQRFFGVLTPDEQETLYRLLRRLADSHSAWATTDKEHHQ